MGTIVIHSAHYCE